MIAKFKLWGAIAGAVILAVLGAFISGRRTGSLKQRTKDAVRRAKVQHEVDDVMREVDDEMAMHKDRGAQRVGDSSTDTAAGWLRDNASRD